MNKPVTGVRSLEPPSAGHADSQSSGAEVVLARRFSFVAVIGVSYAILNSWVAMSAVSCLLCSASLWGALLLPLRASEWGSHSGPHTRLLSSPSCAVAQCRPAFRGTRRHALRTHRVHHRRTCLGS